MSSGVFCPHSFKSVRNYLLSCLLWISRALCRVVYPCRVWIILREYIQYLCRNINIFLFRKGKNKTKSRNVICVSVSVPFSSVFLEKCSGSVILRGPLGPSMYSASADRLHCQLVRKIPLLSLFSLSTKCKVRAVKDGSTYFIEADILIYYSKIVCKFPLENTSKDDPVDFFTVNV